MQCGQYEKLVNDSTLLQPDEYIFLYTNNDSIMQRNKTREKELSKAWIDRSRTWFCTIETGLKIVVEPDIREWILVAHKMAFADV